MPFNLLNSRLSVPSPRPHTRVLVSLFYCSQFLKSWCKIPPNEHRISVIQRSRPLSKAIRWSQYISTWQNVSSLFFTHSSLHSVEGILVSTHLCPLLFLVLGIQERIRQTRPGLWSLYQLEIIPPTRFLFLK